MNWKLIGKYTGFIFLATFIVGFAYGIINTVLKEDIFVIPILTNLVIMVIIFANLAIEQRRRTPAHASLVTLFWWLISVLFIWLISLPINDGLVQQLFFIGVFSLIGCLIIASVGVAVGLVLRPRDAKPNLPVRREDKIPTENIKIIADTIVFCLYCRTKNRLKKGTLIGIKPVCGNCGSVLEIKKSPPNTFDDEHIDKEYVDVIDDNFIETSSPINIEVISVGNQTKPDDFNPEIHIEEDLADYALKEKVYKLFHYNRQEVHRIIESKKKRFPVKSDRWHWEKTYDDEIRIKG